MANGVNVTSHRYMELFHFEGVRRHGLWYRLSVSFGLLVMLMSHFTVERGLMEIRKLGIEIQLWEESRKLADQDSKMPVHSDF